MIEILRTDSSNTDFLNLVKFLDIDLAIRDGDDHAFYAQFNKVDAIKYVVLAVENGLAVGCGAIKEYDLDTMEVKRMYTSPQNRGKKIASRVLAELENWAKELSYKRCILETGNKQPEAIALYNRNSYQRILNYGQYANVENSLCFEKVIS